MSKRSLGSIILDVEARTQRLETQMKRANSVTRKYSLSMRKGFDGVSAAAKRIALALGALVVPASIGILVKRSLEAGDALAKTSDKLGIATEKLAGLQLAAELNGVSIETMNTSLQRMTRRVAEAGQGTGEAVKALAELGLNAKELASLAPDEQFKRIADAMGGVANQGDKVRLAMKLFDTEGVGMLNVLRLGADGLDKLIEKAKQYGLALSRLDAAKIEGANDAILLMQKRFAGIAMMLTVEVAPALSLLAGELDEAAKSTDGLSGMMRSLVDGVVTGLGFVQNAFYGWNLLIKTTRLMVAEFTLDFVEAMKATAERLERFVTGVLEKVNYMRDLWNKIPFNPIELKPLVSDGLKNKILEYDEVIKGLQNTVIDLGVSLNDVFEKGLPSEKIARKLQILRSDAQGNAWITSMGPLDFSQKGNKAEPLWGEATFGAVAKFETLSNQVSVETEKMTNAANTLGESFEGVFSSAIRGGGNLIDVLGRMKDRLMDIALEEALIKPLGGLLGTLFGGPIGGLFGSILGGMFGGGRASGGPVAAGVPYMVGEQGPELFVPSASGRIVPNGGGGGSAVVNVYNNFALGVSDTVRAEMIGMMPAFRANAVAAVDEARTRRKTRRAG